MSLSKHAYFSELYEVIFGCLQNKSVSKAINIKKCSAPKVKYRQEGVWNGSAVCGNYLMKSSRHAHLSERDVLYHWSWIIRCLKKGASPLQNATLHIAYYSICLLS